MLTVAFASFNGADTLPLMLDALTRVRAPAGGWRLIAVDNASTDDTYNILASYRDHLPITILEQPAPGKSKALNLALKYVEGDLLVLTDDDVIPDVDWLIAWRKCADLQTEFGSFGGTIRPHWQHPPPDWLVSSVPLGVAYAITPERLPNGLLDPTYVSGPNMAMRTEAILGGLRFDETRGPSGVNYAMGEDTLFIRDAQKRGFLTTHCPKAVVRHIVMPEQYRRSWLLRRAYRFGQSRGMQGARSGKNSGSSHWLGVPRWMLMQYLTQLTLSTAGWLSRNTERSMSAAWEARYTRGYMAGYRIERKRLEHRV